MSLVQTVDWATLAPPTIPAVAAVVVLLADLFLPEARKGLLGWLALTGLALAALSLLPLRAGDRATFCGAVDGGAAVCAYAADPFTVIIQLLVLGGAFLTALLSFPLLSSAGVPGAGAVPRGEFWFLLLASAAGAALLPAARDMATLVIALEVTTLPAYALVALRRDSRTGPEAAVKFFLSSVTASAVTLLGVSFVYAGAGSLYLPEIAAALPEADPALATLATAGVALTLVGFAFKAGAVPFHFWVPETYLGAPLPVAGYLSVVGKTAGLAGLVLVTTGAFPAYGWLWGPVLAVLAGLTMTAGNVAAVAALHSRSDAPHSGIRLLAWSSLGQAGYLLVPIAVAGYAGGDGAGVSAAVGTMVAYALMYAAVNLGAFAVAVHVAGQHPAHRVDDYRGLYARHPLTALAMAFFLLCLAGLPPGVIGLFAKVAVVEQAVDAGLGAVAVVMALNVVVALYYYLRWAALLFLSPAAAPAAALTPDQATSGTVRSTSAPSAPAPSAPASSAAADPVPASSAPAPSAPAPSAPAPSAPASSAAADPVPAPPAPAPSAAAVPATAAGAAGVRVAIALATIVALTLSAAPQIVLMFASGALL